MPMMSGGYSYPYFNFTQATQLTAVFACVDLVSSKIAETPFIVMEQKENALIKNKNHPISKLLNSKPNHEMIPFELFKMMSRSLELEGNFYAEIVRMKGIGVSSINPIPVNKMHVDIKNGKIKYTANIQQSMREIKKENILHMRVNLDDGLVMGRSVLSLCSEGLQNAWQTFKSQKSYFENSMNPSGVFMMNSQLSPEQRKDFYDLIQENFIGARNAGKPMILELGEDFKSVSHTARDGKLIESMYLAIEEICRAFRVPPAMIYHNANVGKWPDSHGQQNAVFYKHTLRSRFEIIQQFLTRALLTEKEIKSGMFVRADISELLKSDPSENATYLSNLVAAGLMTGNEARERLGIGLLPIDGLDDITRQMQDVPVGTQNQDSNNAES